MAPLPPPTSRTCPDGPVSPSVQGTTTREANPRHGADRQNAASTFEVRPVLGTHHMRETGGTSAGRWFGRCSSSCSEGSQPMSLLCVA